MKRFISKYYFLPAIALLTLVSVVAVRCKKPTEGININVNTSGLFHYTGLVQIIDASGAVPNNLSVTVTGPNAAAVYGTDGRKTLGAPAGIVTFAIHPKMEPTANSPLTFNLVVSGPGYLTVIIPVTVKTTDKEQVINASILNLTVPTAGVASTTTTASVSAGTVAAPITVATPPASTTTTTTAVTVPTGTKLQDANGNTINGNTVAATVNSFKPSTAGVIDLFPGSSLTTNNFVDAGGATTSAALIPAGFANIQMSVNGTEVKKFSAPIAVTMSLDPSFKNPNTGVALAAGQTVEIDSYDTGTGQWKFEQNATVANVGGNLVVNFNTTHLTIYTATVRLTVKTSLNLSITTSTPVADGQTYGVYYVATSPSVPFPLASGIVVLTSEGVSSTGFAFDWGGIFPSVATDNITVTFAAAGDHSVIYGTTTIAPNATSINANLTLTSPGPLTTLVLKLDCSGAGSNKVGIFTPPDFILLYKKTGASASAYQPLGTVSNGQLITNQLLTTQNYDFKAVLGNQSKEVLNHNVSENVPANQTVGGTFNGTKVPVKNQLDIQSLCNTLP